MENNLKEILGESYKAGMTIEEVQSALDNNGTKLADLSKGGYVAKEKHTRLESDYESERARYNELAEKTKDYEDLFNYKKTSEAKKAEDGIKNNLIKAGFKKEFVELGMFEIQKGSIKNENEEGLIASAKEFLKGNPTYGNPEGGQGQGDGNAQGQNQNQGQQGNTASINTGFGTNNDPSASSAGLPKQVDVKPWNKNRS